jgi:hypothetical protein
MSKSTEEMSGFMQTKSKSKLEFGISMANRGNNFFEEGKP